MIVARARARTCSAVSRVWHADAMTRRTVSWLERAVQLQWQGTTGSWEHVILMRQGRLRCWHTNDSQFRGNVLRARSCACAPCCATHRPSSIRRATTQMCCPQLPHDAAAWRHLSDSVSHTILTTHTLSLPSVSRVHFSTSRSSLAPQWQCAHIAPVGPTHHDPCHVPVECLVTLLRRSVSERPKRPPPRPSP